MLCYAAWSFWDERFRTAFCVQQGLGQSEESKEVPSHAEKAAARVIYEGSWQEHGGSPHALN